MSMMFTRPELELPLRDTGSSSQGSHEFVRVATVIVGPSDTCDFITNGVADEVTINLALAYALSIGGGEVILMEWRYVLAASINIPGNSLILRGFGVATFIDGDALLTNNHAIVLSGFTDVVLRDFSIQTNDGGGLTCHCIFIEDGADRFRVINVTILNSADNGIHVEGTTIDGGWIINCVILDADGYAIFVTSDGANFKYRIHIVGCSVYGGSYGIILQTGVNYSTVIGCTVTGVANAGIYVLSAYNAVEGNTLLSCGNVGIDLNNANYSTVSGNIVYLSGTIGIQLSSTDYAFIGNNISHQSVYGGIQVTASNLNVISGNICTGNNTNDAIEGAGIYIGVNARDNVVSGNSCSLNHRYGILAAEERTILSGNNCTFNDFNGIRVVDPECTVVGNYCYDNGQEAAATYHEIVLGVNADRCLVMGNYLNSPGDSSEDCIHLVAGAVNVLITGNFCYNGMGSGIVLTANNDNCLISGNYLMENDDYGIEIAAATCDNNMVIWNYFSGNVTGPFLDNGTNTWLASLTFQFVKEIATATYLTTSPTGIEIDLATEGAIAQGWVPLMTQMVVRFRIGGVGLAAPGAGNGMCLNITVNAGKPLGHEAYNAEAIAVADKVTTEDNFAVNDAIEWTIDASDDADIDDIMNGETFECLVLHNAVVGGDIATDAIVRTVTVEFV